MSASQVRKGKAREREVVALARAAGFPEAQRTGPDVSGVPDAWVSVKGGRYPRPLPALAEARRDAAPSARVPLVAFRGDRGEWFGAVPLAALLDLMAFSWRHRGSSIMEGVEPDPCDVCEHGEAADADPKPCRRGCP